VANEKVQLVNPAPGEYHVYIDLWALAGPEETECQVFLHSFVVEEDGVGEFTVTPESFDTEVGVPQEMVFSWTGLEGPPPLGSHVPSPDVRRYLGFADYMDGETLRATTLLRVDVPAGEPTSPPTTSPPTTEPTTSPVPTTSLPGTGAGSAGLYAGLGLGALVLGGLLVAMAARRLRTPAK
jgi:hypothetical protein